jgi:hypothetical protein
MYSAYYPKGSLSKKLPFDAVSIPGSSVIQYLARDASKPGRSEESSANKKKQELELWTAIGTAQFSESVQQKSSSSGSGGEGETKNKKNEAVAIDLVLKELSSLLGLYFNGLEVPQPVQAHVKL